MSGLDTVMDGLDHAMFIVTATSNGQHAGCLVGFASQVSIDPERMLVCLSIKNHTYDVAREGSVLAVHVLRSDQVELAALFGSETGDELDKFARCRWEAGPHGVPLLVDAMGWMVGSILMTVPLGDHVGFVLEPVQTRPRDAGDALTFEDVKHLTPGHQA